MEKDAYYFSHDSNARFDNKIIKLRAKYGLEGYGFYFCLLEIMRDNADYTINYNDIDAIAFQLQIDSSKAKAMLDDCLNFGLFLLDDNSIIYSESLLNRMEKMNDLRAKRQEAGRKGGKAKAMLKQNPSIKGKENKGNKSKPKQIDIYCSPKIEKIFALYTENCTNLLRLGFEKRNRQIRELVAEFLKETDYNYDYFIDVCKKANELKQIANNKIDLKSLLNNHIGIMNGKYKQETQIKNKLVFK